MIASGTYDAMNIIANPTMFAPTSESKNGSLFNQQCILNKYSISKIYKKSKVYTLSLSKIQPSYSEKIIIYFHYIVSSIFLD